MEENEKREELTEEEKEEKEEEEKREERRREKEQYQKQIDEERSALKKFREIQEEVDNLNNNLSACINVVSDSIVNVALRKRYETMRQVNRSTYMKANREVGNAIDEKEKTITRLQDEKDQLEEKEEKKDN